MSLNVSSYKTIWTAFLLTVKILTVTLLFFIAYSTKLLITYVRSVQVMYFMMLGTIS
jgi:hypothetical protein